MSSRSGTGAVGDSGVLQQHELPAADVARTVARMANQIIERTAPAAVVPLGVPTCGVPLAHRLAELIGVLYSRRTVRAHSTRSASTAGPAPCNSRCSSTGAIGSCGVRADHVGKDLPTSRDEEVAVLLTETDGTDALMIRRGAR